MMMVPPCCAKSSYKSRLTKSGKEILGFRLGFESGNKQWIVYKKSMNEQHAMRKDFPCTLQMKSPGVGSGGAINTMYMFVTLQC